MTYHSLFDVGDWLYIKNIEQVFNYKQHVPSNKT